MSRQKHIICFVRATGLMLATVFWLSACSTSAGGLTTPITPTAMMPAGSESSQALTPYHTPTLFTLPSPTTAATLTPLPSPTPAPRSHIIKKGEDLGGIAYLYHVTVADIMAANPTVDPHAMSVGTELVIPASKTPQAQAAGTGTPNAAAPTPIPVTLGAAVCSRSLDGGIWCFQSVHNTQGFAVESVSARLRISGAALGQPTEQTTIEQIAFLPLDVLPDGVTLALSAYFPPEQAAAISGPLQVGSELLNALPNPNDGRYLPARVEQTQVRIAPDSLAAEIETEIRLEAQNASAKRVWVAATAYDAQGNVVGTRRWENDNAHRLESGQALKITFSIYSVSGKIARVDLVPEARP